MATVPIDAKLAPEVVEFWGFKYQQVKDELEKLKDSINIGSKKNEVDSKSDMDILARTADEENDQKEAQGAVLRELHHTIVKLQTENVGLVHEEKRLKKELGEARKAEMAALQQLDTMSAAHADYSQKFGRVHTEHTGLLRQSQIFSSQAYHLAQETDTQRAEALAVMDPPNSFLEDSYELSPFHFIDPSTVLPSLPASIAYATRLCFVPRPPKSMPLRVKKRAQVGYWFHPIWPIPHDTVFELIVEGKPSEWSYLGRYTSTVMNGWNMRLSEWLSLDESTKIEYCARIASARYPSGVVAPQGEQQRVRWQIDTGDITVPCFHLHCVGFSKELVDAFKVATRQYQHLQGPGTSVGEYNRLPAIQQPRPRPPSIPLAMAVPIPALVPGKKRRRGSDAENEIPDPAHLAATKPVWGTGPQSPSKGAGGSAYGRMSVKDDEESGSNVKKPKLKQ